MRYAIAHSTNVHSTDAPGRYSGQIHGAQGAANNNNQ
jgi:hypothetical protein